MMKAFASVGVAALMLMAALPSSPARAHGCHAAPQYDQQGYHRHIRHCLRITLPPPR